MQPHTIIVADETNDLLAHAAQRQGITTKQFLKELLIHAANKESVYMNGGKDMAHYNVALDLDVAKRLNLAADRSGVSVGELVIDTLTAVADEELATA